ncbi:hypothetical protein Ddye_027251 [Dipteronia dyeriana]|uniref:Reverse transcriptase domain-containing protein n=1 Tax=Dipteronia dyeriana TaxID=168575 RepID=A0AAD9TPE4_9ROSI|nr:hypothetical protein Ddye_027251 [Dipteronia dyeriana]
MTWNIRGLGKVDKRKFVWRVINKHRPAICFLQESKLNVFDSKVFKSLGGQWLNRVIGKDSIGSVGGLIMLWNDDLLEVKACIKNNSCIILAGVLLKQGKDIVFYNVYAPNVEREREELYDFILGAQTYFLMPWCIRGDFNTVLRAEERKGGSSVSGHSVVLIGEPRVDLGDKLINQAKVGWMSCKASGSAGFFLSKRVISTKKHIHKFLSSKEIDSFSLKEYESCLDLAEKRVVLEGCTVALGIIRLDILSVLWKGIWKEEQLLRQKSRMRWLKDEDRNFMFFHCIANNRMQSNHIDNVMIGGIKILDPCGVKLGIRNHFSKLFRNVLWQMPNISGLYPKKLGSLWKFLLLKKRCGQRMQSNHIDNVMIGGIKILDPCGVKLGIRNHFSKLFKNVLWQMLNISGLYLKKLESLWKFLLMKKRCGQRSPTSQFGVERGLWQGDPLSPFLFNIVTEGLSCLIDKAAGLGLVGGATFDNDIIQITHLQYADDTMLFLKPKRPVFDWEKKQWTVFFCCLERISIRNVIPDILAWVNNTNGKFSVASFRKCIEEVSMSAEVDYSDVWQGGIGDSRLDEILAVHREATICSQSSFLRNTEMEIVSDSSKIVSWVYSDGPKIWSFLTSSMRFGMPCLFYVVPGYASIPDQAILWPLCYEG